ncbi:unnamed protein product [Notodromas monacha]|uniref:BTB domain-containing protein n=1 Tax=Notodromas monacha TaxID=399045 RepID=A0A7R9G9G1_9CRUS|nr:unnamed protein product [Notodromas monacha]CAG0912592.1 unnamed protein product [Notodromas monacha]
MEDYDLTWSQHGEETFRAFVDLRAGSAHVDVLLFCGDDTLEAHKVILAASSSYFERLLNTVANEYSRYTIVALAQMDPFLLRLVVDFMYSGSVTVPFDRLEEFMAMADLLEVRGLESSADYSLASRGKRSGPLKRKSSARMPLGVSHLKVPALTIDSKPGTSHSAPMHPGMVTEDHSQNLNPSAEEHLSCYPPDIKPCKIEENHTGHIPEMPGASSKNPFPMNFPEYLSECYDPEEMARQCATEAGVIGVAANPEACSRYLCEMEDYDLTWSEHGDESFRAFMDLRAGSSHVDVLLFCGDDTLEAHKVILAACSSYFERLLNAVANDYSRYTIVAMAQVDPFLLRLAIDFMYSGKVTVPFDRLEEFMALADLLEVRGLKSSTEHALSSLGKRITSLKRKATAQVPAPELHPKVPALMIDSKPGTSHSDLVDPEMVTEDHSQNMDSTAIDPLLFYTEDVKPYEDEENLSLHTHERSGASSNDQFAMQFAGVRKKVSYAEKVARQCAYEAGVTFENIKELCKRCDVQMRPARRKNKRGETGCELQIKLEPSSSSMDDSIGAVESEEYVEDDFSGLNDVHGNIPPEFLKQRPVLVSLLLFTACWSRAMEDYNLTWTQHGEESFRAFVDLRAGSSHVDVLLFCGDDTLEAHKVILAACSSYFERLLNAVANDYSRYTIVALARMDPYLLRLAVNFMYSGKVTVPCDRLEEFMSLADLLEVRGLKANPEHGIASFGKRMNPMKRKASAQMLSGESHSKVPAAMSDSKPGTSQSDVMDPEMDPGCELEIKEEPNSSSMDDGFVAVESEEYVEDDFGGLSDVPGNIPPAFLKQTQFVRIGTRAWHGRRSDGVAGYFCEQCLYSTCRRGDVLRHERSHLKPHHRRSSASRNATASSHHQQQQQRRLVMGVPRGAAAAAAASNDDDGGAGGGTAASWSALPGDGGDAMGEDGHQ